MTLDARIERGMAALLRLRRERLDAGERPLGWKLGFGSSSGMAQLRTDRPIVGFLTDRSVLPAGASCAIGEWGQAALEPEVAVHLARDVDAGAGLAGVEDAIGGIGPAIELVDIGEMSGDVERILAGNIFHRHVILGPVVGSVRPGEPFLARVLRDGEEIARTDDPAAATGDVIDVVASAAETLEAVGERLQAGAVVITGSVVPAVAVGPGERIRAELGPLGALDVTLT